jgi:hypothetical protein
MTWPSSRGLQGRVHRRHEPAIGARRGADAARSVWRQIVFRLPKRDDRKDIGALYFDKKQHDPELVTPSHREEFARSTEDYALADIKQVLSLAMVEDGRGAFNWKDIRGAMAASGPGWRFRSRPPRTSPCRAVARTLYRTVPRHRLSVWPWRSRNWQERRPAAAGSVALAFWPKWPRSWDCRRFPRADFPLKGQVNAAGVGDRTGPPLQARHVSCSRITL